MAQKASKFHSSSTGESSEQGRAKTTVSFGPHSPPRDASSWKIDYYSTPAPPWTENRRLHQRPEEKSPSNSGAVPEEKFPSNSGAVPEEQFGSTVSFPFDVRRLGEAIEEFEDSFKKTKVKIHRLPPSQHDLSKRYTVPMAVGIGPYHSGSTTTTMKMAKEAAFCYFSESIIRSAKDLFKDFITAVGDVRSLYLENDPAILETVVGRDPVRFNWMMLRDGCFLMQYMLAFTTDRDEMPPSLVSFFDSNEGVISNDIMLLENQLPWVVIQTLRRIKEVPVEEFIAKMGRTLQIRKEKEEKPFRLDSRYPPPHLLGLLYLYKSGRSNTLGNNQNKSFSLIKYCCYNNGGVPPSDGPRPSSRTTSAIELAEIGIKLKPSRTTKFIDMGIKKKLFSGEIFLAPLLLDEIRACWLLNMAVLELCMGEIFQNKIQNYVVGSYLAVFAMLMDREEDVHELRSKRLIQGGLTNKETLDLFKGLTKRISGGPLYNHILEEIEDYKLKRWIWIKVHEFFYKHKKTIVAVLSIIGVLVGIFKALLSLKHH